VVVVGVTLVAAPEFSDVALVVSLLSLSIFNFISLSFFSSKAFEAAVAGALIESLDTGLAGYLSVGF
jgi:hypothetical protein